MSSSELKVFLVSELSEFDGLLLCLVEVIVNTLEFAIVVLALSFLHSDLVSESVDLVLVLGLLLSQLGEFVLEVVGVLSELVDSVSLLREVSLESNALLFSSTDLVSN